jgi:sensor histidine kinase regulating citrate/malate metabolism
MQPLDALCELIDNSIDSFQAAMLKGEPVQSPLVILELPKKQEVNQGTGCVRVRDNGPGLSPEMAEKALRVGFSGNNQYDSLGLFGMGFNISTGKLGRRTRFITSRRTDGAAIEVVIDLEELNAAKSYQVPVTGLQNQKL